jgi:replicative DNA helicase
LGRLAATVRRWKRKLAAKGEKLEVVIVDYLQLIGTDRRSENRVQEVSEVSRGIKQIAKREGVCMVALAQLSRDVEKREDKRPMLSDLRESGQIEQDADTIIFLFREEYYLRMAKPPEDKPDKLAKWQIDLERCENRIEFIAAKLRHGQPGARSGYFFGQNQAVRGSDFYGRHG